MVRLPARLSRSFNVLRVAAGVCAALALAACVNQQGAGGYGAEPAAAGQFGGGGRRIAVLLPLTGANAGIGQALLQGVQLSLASPGSPALDPQDTGGTPQDAAAAAQRAIAAGAGIIIGPLTTTSTAAVAPIARAAGVPVLAFTNDSSQAQPGVWPLGISPAQQVRRLVLAEVAENKTRIAAVAPQTPYGDALASGLNAAAASAGLPPPQIVRAPRTFAGMNDALQRVSDYANRRGRIEAQQREARASRDAAGRREAAELGRQSISPPPMDALLLGVDGDLLSQTVPLLAFYDLGPSQVRILGPDAWAREVARLPSLAGARYAAPDPANRAEFERQYAIAYNQPPPTVVSVAYDAAGIARQVATSDGFSVAGLTRPEGFLGTNGLLALQPDGQVRRGLAIFEVDRGGSHIVDPAPQTFAAPGI